MDFFHEIMFFRLPYILKTIVFKEDKDLPDVILKLLYH